MNDIGVLEGRIEAMQRQGAAIVTRVAAGAAFVVHLTPASAADLELVVGSRVWLIIKTYSCRIAAG